MDKETGPSAPRQVTPRAGPYKSTAELPKDQGLRAESNNSIAASQSKAENFEPGAHMPSKDPSSDTKLPLKLARNKSTSTDATLKDPEPGAPNLVAPKSSPLKYDAHSSANTAASQSKTEGAEPYTAGHHGSALSADIISRIFDLFAKNDPNPATELNYTNEFTLLVAIALSAQTTDKQVNKVSEALFKEITTPQDVIDLGIPRLEETIKSTGFYHNKAKNIYLMAQKLIKDFAGAVPHNVEELITLPGVGRKSANVWMNVMHHAPTIAVDRHVLRVANRLGLASTTSPEETESELTRLVPAKYHPNVSNWLVLHGRYTCKATTPLCTKCFLKKVCIWRKG